MAADDTTPATPPRGNGRAEPEEALIMFLEPDQLAADRTRPVPRAALSSRTSLALWALRVFVLVVSAMVIYTFFVQLGS